MGSAGVKYDIKILFLIVNSLIGLVPGILTFSYGFAFGVNFGVKFGAFPIILIVFGLIILGVAALGYGGAIKEHKITLYIIPKFPAVLSTQVCSRIVKNPYTFILFQCRDASYSGLLALAAVGDLVTYVLMQPTNPHVDPTLLATPIVHLVLTLLSLSLAVILARQVRIDDINNGCVLSPSSVDHTPRPSY